MPKNTQANGEEIKEEPVTTQDLWNILGDNIRRLREGETTPAVANAVVHSGATMLRIIKLQMDYDRATGKTPDIAALFLNANASDDPD